MAAFLESGSSEEQGIEAAEGGDVTAHPSGRKQTRKRSCFSMVSMMEPVDEEDKPADFGSGSVFDAKVRSADEFHFELPVVRYLEETLMGMHGAPKEKGSLEPTGDGRRWARMRKLFATPATHALVKALFWVCISCVFPEEDYATDEEKEALLELRRDMAESWVSLSQGRGPRTIVHGSDSLDEALTMFPVALSQVVFRLLIDAFSDDRDAMLRHAKKWFDKISDAVHREFWGFRANRASSHMLRSKLFIKAVVEHPHANQLESMKSELRLEKYTAARQEPLAFGSQTGEPLDDVQLLELFRWRQSQMAAPNDSTHRAWSPSPSMDRSSLADLRPGMQRAGSETPMASTTGGNGRVPFLPVGAEELNADRYGHLDQEAQELLVEQSKRLYPDTGDVMGHTDGMGHTDVMGHTDRRIGSMGSRRKRDSQPRITEVSEGSRRTGFTEDESRSVGFRRQQRRRSAAAARRRRDERLQELLQEDVAGRDEMTTVLVSPLIECLAPSGGHLQKPHGETLHLRRQPPKADGPLHWDTLDWNKRRFHKKSIVPAMKREKAEDVPTSGRSPGADAEQRRPSARVPDQPPGAAKSPMNLSRIPSCKDKDGPPAGVGRGAAAVAAPVPPAVRPRGEASRQAEIPFERWPTAEDVKERLRMQVMAIHGMSFDVYKMSHDLTTGHELERTDPEGLAAEEAEYVSKVGSLVGAKSASQPTLLHPRAYDIQARRAAPDGGHAASVPVRRAQRPPGAGARQVGLAASASAPTIRVSSSLANAGTFSLGRV